MKKLFFLACFSYGLIGHAQIEINSSGRVSIGDVAPATSTYDLKTINAVFIGTTLFAYEGSSTAPRSDLRIATQYNGSYYWRSIEPTQNNMSKIGTSSRAFNNIYSYNFTTISDSRKKENIKVINSSLDIIKSLRGVTYDLKDEVYFDEESKTSLKAPIIVKNNKKGQIGFIAQEVNEILPEVVHYDEATDIYAMDYTKIIPVLVEAIKEQQEQIEILNLKIVALSEQTK